MEFLQDQRIKIVFSKKKECLNLFNYLKIDKPVFLNFPDNKLDQIPLLKVIKKIEKESNLLNLI